MYTQVMFIKSASTFKPDLYSISFAEDGSMKIEIFSLTVSEIDSLLDQIKVALLKAKEAGL